MSDTVEYIIKLKDEMSGTVNAVKHSTSAMNKEIEHSQSVVHELRNAFFELFAAEKILEFFNGAREALEKYKFASAELDATLEANGENIGFTRKELDALGDAARKNTLYTREETIAMEGQLAMFHNIHGLIAQEAIPAVLDLAAKMKTKPAEAAHALGLALDAPAKAARVLRQANITLSDAQEKQIKLWVDTGEQAKAQQFILDTLTTSTRGAAAAAWEAADPLARLGIRFEDTKIKVGTLIEELLEKLEPAMNAVVDVIEDGIDFVKEFSPELTTLAGVTLAATTAFIAYTIAQKAAAFWTAITTTTVKSSGIALVFQTLLTYGLADAWAMLNMVIMANPFVAVIAIIIAVGAAIYELYQRFEKFRAVVDGVWEVMKQFGENIGEWAKGIYHILHGAFSFNKAEISKGLEDVLDVYLNAGAKMRTAFGKGYANSLAVSATVKSAGAENKKAKGHGIQPPPTDLHTGAGEVKETKPTIINITMGSLVNTFTVGVTNLTEGSAKVREEVLKAMISAVNDSQVHAIGHT